MIKRTAVLIVALALAFWGGSVVGVKQATPPTNDQFVGVDGSIIPFEEVPESLRTSTTTTEVVSVQTSGIPSRTAVQTYTSPFGFSVQYDDMFQAENAWVVLPGNERVAAFALVRYVPVQHCGASGRAEHCRALLENPAIAFGVLDVAPRDVVAKHLGAFAQYLESVTVNGKVAAQYYAAADGEGVVTILVPLTNENQTLIVQYTYDTKYDTESPHNGIRSSAEQKKLIDSVLQTLTII